MAQASSHGQMEILTWISNAFNGSAIGRVGHTINNGQRAHPPRVLWKLSCAARCSACRWR